MSLTQPPSGARAQPPTVATAGRRAINEDWLATIVGLILVFLVLAGVITNALVP